MTHYECLLQELSGRVGCGEAYVLLKNRVNAQIEQALKQAGVELESL